MPRVYLTGSSLGRGYITGSGVISNPARTILALRDNATSSYPTVSRIGDPGRTGRYSINFNDTDSVVFNSNVTTSYPSDLQLADAAYISQSIATPNMNATIEATGIVRKGVADANITFTTGEDLTPFVEDNLFASTAQALTDPFYITGSTVADVGLGFTNPLRSKTKIEIDLNPIASDIFGFISGNNPAAAKSAQDLSEDPNVWPMTYYNFDNRRFQRIGSGMPSATVDGGGDRGTNAMLIKSGTVGFNRGTELVSEGLSAQCRPISSFGFPSDTRYHATSSHLYPMSGVLDEPFLVEKFVYEFKASYWIGSDYSDRDVMFSPDGAGMQPDETALGRASIMSFFILNQRRPMSSSYPTYPTINLNNGGGSSAAAISSVSFPILIPSSTQLTLGGQYTNVDTYRDLVTYGQATVFTPGTGDASFMNEAISTGGLGREVNINANAATAPMTASFVMSGTVKTTPAFTSGPIYRISKWPDNDNDKLVISTNYQGTRSGIELTGNRGLTSNTPGATISGSLTDLGITIDGQGTSDSYSITTFEDYDIVSPYLLKPEDNLVFGWQLPMPMGWKRASDGGTGPNMQVLPGKGKLTLYGSLVSDHKEHHNGLNQPLTSDAVHEFIGFHGPPLDQFDTEPRQQFSGSMFSNVITGSITTTEQPAVGLYAVSPTLRGVAGQRATGEWTGGQFTSLGSSPSTVHTISNINGITRKPGSFSRSSLLSCENEAIYDSFPPDIFQIYQKLAEDPTYVNSGIWNIFVGTTPINPDPGTPSWRRFFPFEPSVSGTPRTVTGDLSSNSGLDYQSVKSYTGTTLGSVRSIYANIESGVWLYDLESGPAADNIKIFLYGTGDYKSFFNSTLNGGPSMWGAFAGIGPTAFGYGYVRGFKYGLYHANKRSTYCKFRSDKYGQFRDMLEQRMDTRVYSETSGRSTISASPVQVRFVASDGTSESPSKTTSSNLSQFATSSLPYFDGVARNRGPIVTSDLGLTIVSI